MSDLRRIASGDVKAGMVIHSIEEYPGGAVVQFRGEVDYVFFDDRGVRCAQMVGVPAWDTKDREPLRVDLFEVLHA